MDPNAALARIRELTTSVNLANDLGSADDPVDSERMAITACNLAEAVDALDEWLSKGGFAPAAWVAEPVWVDGLAVNVSVGVNNVEDHMAITIEGRTIKLGLRTAAWLYKQIGRRLDMQPKGFIDTGDRI